MSVKCLFFKTPGHPGRVCLCVFITAVPITMLFAWGEGDSESGIRRASTALDHVFFAVAAVPIWT